MSTITQPRCGVKVGNKSIDARDDARGRARARPGTTTRDEDVAMLSTPREGGLRGARRAVVDDARGRTRAREGMNDEEK